MSIHIYVCEYVCPYVYVCMCVRVCVRVCAELMAEHLGWSKEEQQQQEKYVHVCACIYVYFLVHTFFQEHVRVDPFVHTSVYVSKIAGTLI